MKNSKRKSISEKLSKHYRVSYKKAFRDIFPDVMLLLKDPDFQDKIEIEEDEMAWVNEKLLGKS